MDGGDRSVWTNDDLASITQNETAIALDMCHHPHPELTLWAGSSRRKPAQHRRRRRHPLAAGTRARPGRARRRTACHHTPRTNQPRTMTAMAVASRGEGSVPGGPPRSYLRSWRSVESGMSWRDIAAPRAHPITPPTVRNDGGSDGHAPVIVTKLIVSVTNSGSVNEGAATAPGRQHCNETWSARNEMGQRGDAAGVRGRIRPALVDAPGGGQHYRGGGLRPAGRPCRGWGRRGHAEITGPVGARCWPRAKRPEAPTHNASSDRSRNWG